MQFIVGIQEYEIVISMCNCNFMAYIELLKLLCTIQCHTVCNIMWMKVELLVALSNGANDAQK